MDTPLAEMFIDLNLLVCPPNPLGIAGTVTLAQTLAQSITMADKPPHMPDFIPSNGWRRYTPCCNKDCTFNNPTYTTKCEQCGYDVYS